LIEIPGGAVDMRTVESTEDAAKRELLEETGYSPTKVEFLGWQYPNPAYQSNKLWTYLALGCELIQNQNLDEFEDIDVILAEPQKVISMIKKGEITHSLVLSSLLLALEHLKP
jgi:8-oxo-dGTP pyrophosphatase MutT (NUDIX family)